MPFFGKMSHNGMERYDNLYVFSRTTDFAVLPAEHGLEARATTARMAVLRGYFARVNAYEDLSGIAQPWNRAAVIKQLAGWRFHCRRFLRGWRLLGLLASLASLRRLNPVRLRDKRFKSPKFRSYFLQELFGLR